MTITKFLDENRDSRYQILGIGGKIYSVVTGPQLVASSGYMALEITNPADSNMMIDVIRVEGGSTTDITLDFFRNSDINVSGTTLYPLNRNWYFGDTSSITARYINQDANPVSGGDMLTSVVGTGGSLSIKYDGEFILPSQTTNETFSIRARNETSDNNTISLSITWIEV